METGQGPITSCDHCGSRQVKPGSTLPLSLPLPCAGSPNAKPQQRTIWAVGMLTPTLQWDGFSSCGRLFVLPSHAPVRPSPEVYLGATDACVHLGQSRCIQCRPLHHSDSRSIHCRVLITCECKPWVVLGLTVSVPPATP